MQRRLKELLPRKAWPVILIYIIIFFSIPSLAPGYLVALLITTLMYIVLAEGWFILSGLTGYIFLGSAAFFGFGAYLMGLAYQAIPIWLVVILAGLLAAGLASVIGYPALRVKGAYFIILSYGISEFLRNVFSNYENLISFRTGRIISVGFIQPTVYYALSVLALVSMLAAFVIKKSKFGIGLLSIREDEDAAETMGVNTTRYKLIAFTLAALFSGFTGALVALQWSYIDPSVVFNPLISIQVIMVAYLGGTREFYGPVLGVAVITLLYQVLWANYPYFYLILMGLILALVILFLPEGVAGLIKRARKWILA